MSCCASVSCGKDVVAKEAGKIMGIYMVRLIGRDDVADGTRAFHFEKPEGFVYKAGQFADFTERGQKAHRL